MKKKTKKGGTRVLVGGLAKAKPGKKPKKAKPAAEAPPAKPETPVKPEDVILPSREEWVEVVEMSESIAELTLKEQTAKAVHAAAKKRLEEAQDSLNTRLTDLRDPSRHREVFPFKGTPAETLSMAADKAAPKPAGMEVWRLDPIDDLPIADNLKDLLRNAGVENMNSLQKSMQSGANWFRDIKGIGEGKAEKIADAYYAHIQRREKEAAAASPAPAQPGAETPAPESPGVTGVEPAYVIGDDIWVNDLELDWNLKHILDGEATFKVDGESRFKPAWSTLGEIRLRAIGPKGTIGNTPGRLTLIPGIDAKAEMAIEDAINKARKEALLQAVRDEPDEDEEPGDVEPEGVDEDTQELEDEPI